jgi:methylated-DNA-protein-cysteine methyltransferase related protein
VVARVGVHVPRPESAVRQINHRRRFTPTQRMRHVNVKSRDARHPLGQALSKLARLRHVIAGVPRGKVITYGQVAAAGGFPGAARLTVWALQRGEGLPWHRVVGAGGRIALPGEEGREQRLRLEIEGVKFRGGRVRMDLHNWTPRLRGDLARRRRDNPPGRQPAKNTSLRGKPPHFVADWADA